MLSVIYDIILIRLILLKSSQYFGIIIITQDAETNSQVKDRCVQV